LEHINMSRRLPLAALAAALTLGAGAVAYSQTTTSVWDPAQLPETKGSVKQFTLTPRGDVDGLILGDGTEVKFPPHLTGQLVSTVKTGDAVTIHGLKARALPLVQGASITNDATGNIVTDNGPPGEANRAAAEQTLSGRITSALHGPRGDVNGALLDDGTVLRLPPPEANRMANLLQAGQTVAVRGITLRTGLGTVVDVRAIGPTPDQLTELAPPRGPKGGPKHDRRPADFGPPPPPPRG
jgi:hypothetical protein